MPVQIEKRDGKWVVTDGKKVFGRHDSKAVALRQKRAINR
jgi:hypothetical protein